MNLNEFGSGFFPEPPNKSQADRHLDFGFVEPEAEKPAKPTQTSDLQNCETVNLCWFKLLKLS